MKAMAKWSWQSPNLEILKLAACSGFGVSGAVVSVAVSALVARALGWNGAWSTVPYGIQFLSVLLATLPSARCMSRYGRKPVFVIAAGCGVIAGLAGYWAVRTANPYALCIAHALLGINLANVNFYRFAALEVAPANRRASAMALVISGGTFAAILGPLISREAFFAGTVFASSYLSISVLSLLIAAIVSSSKLSFPESAPVRMRLVDLMLAIKKSDYTIGMLTAALSYGIMNLMMIAAAISMAMCGISYETISFSVQYHVLAMFVPSLFMGRIIRAFGALPVMMAGTAVLLASAIAAIAEPVAILGFQTSLVMLGLAWNMMYLGGSYLVSQSVLREHTISLQAISDLIIGIFAMFGAFAPGLLLEHMGWSGLNLAALAVSLCFFLLLAITVLLLRSPRQPVTQ